ncbi:MAG TPA: hypothetical protein VLH75_06275 [Longimicrobiales bacterium]|nr:hypothetical protein [Longimicrobiales bacterium]
MSEHPCFVPWYARTKGSLAVTPLPGAEEPTDDRLPLTFWLDGHPVISGWFQPYACGRVRESALFAEPLTLALIFVFPRVAPGLMRVTVSAVPETDAQVGALLQLYDHPEHGLPLMHVGHGRLALPLGQRWIPVPPDLAALVEAGTTEALGAVERFATDVQNRILYGEDHEIAVRLLESIPGIRGEVVEA